MEKQRNIALHDWAQELLSMQKADWRGPLLTSNGDMVQVALILLRDADSNDVIKAMAESRRHDLDEDTIDNEQAFDHKLRGEG